MKKYFICILILPLVISVFAIPAFSQENKQEGQQQQAEVVPIQTPVPATPVPPPAEVPVSPATNELSIYGEVQSVNAAANSMIVQYYDYDNDEEKSIEITLDKASKLENVKDMPEIKKGDWADITYTVSAGKNVAKIVSVEKEEPVPEENTPITSEE